jgi:hypothetical protein
VLDLAGRRMVSRDVGALGPGSHLLRLSEGRSLAPGIYLVRLSRGNRSLTASVTVIR